MCSLADILKHGTGLPRLFMEQRRIRMVAIYDRLVLGSTEPIPDMPRWPGIYEPKGDTINPELAAMERARAMHDETRAVAMRNTWALRRAAA